jgi:uncharacterized Zn finger protein
MTNPMNLSLNDTEEVTCDKCGHKYFEQAVYIRSASGLLTGTGVPSYIPIPVFKCSSCGHVNEEFLPREVRSLQDIN